MADKQTLSEIQLTLPNSFGLHARPASLLVRLAQSFDAKIWIEYESQRCDAKSFLSIMLLAAEQGAKVKVTASGPDANMALEAISDLFRREFDNAEVSPGPSALPSPLSASVANAAR